MGASRKKANQPERTKRQVETRRRVFAVLDGEKDLFPAFQFADGKPLPIIQKILEVLPDYLSPWQTAFGLNQVMAGWAEKPHENVLKTKARSLTLLSN